MLYWLGTINKTELQSSGVLSLDATSFLNSQTVISNRPKAYVNWILFDEQFKYAGGGFEQVGSDQEFKTHVKTDMPIDKSGYLYVYVSNETPNIDVFFDNLQVTHIRGAILEESHYYPFGLTMAGISSKAAGSMQNRYKFNDGTELESGEFSDGSGLDLYATDYRSYDPQLGRFHQIDPLADEDEGWSPFAFACNNPILINDPLGLQGDSTQPAPLPLPPGFAPNPVTDPNAPRGSEVNPIPTGIDVVVTSSGNSSTPIQPVNEPIAQHNPVVITPSANNSNKNTGSTAAQLLPVVVVTSTRINPVTVGISLAVGLGYVAYLNYNNPSYAESQRYFGSPDNTTIYSPPYLLMAEHTSNQRPSNWNTHTNRRPGKQYDVNQNERRGNKNKKFKPKPNSNKRKKQ